MPEVRLETRNQCLADGSTPELARVDGTGEHWSDRSGHRPVNFSGLERSGPEKFTIDQSGLRCSAEDEAAATAPNAPEPVAAFGGTDGLEGGSNAGSDALVRRFEDGGAGGAPGTPGALSAHAVSCPREDLSALVVCSGVLRADGAFGVAVASLACVASLIGVAECGSETKTSSAR